MESAHVPDLPPHALTGLLKSGPAPPVSHHITRIKIGFNPGTLNINSDFLPQSLSTPVDCAHTLLLPYHHQVELMVARTGLDPKA